MFGFGRGAGRGAKADQDKRPGRMGGRLVAGPDGNCVCPHCGYKETHVAGTPCMQKQCPQCGTRMVRE
jgi:hypothetical protein